jgi:hypothetical protein
LITAQFSAAPGSNRLDEIGDHPSAAAARVIWSRERDGVQSEMVNGDDRTG